MLRKYAEATIIGAEIAKRDAFGLVKAAHRAVFDYEPRPGYLYVRSRMISSRCNDNFDDFPAEEIKASWKTAKGRPAFVNHHNETHKRMRGVIIDAALHEDILPDGKPDVWIEALHEIDAKKFPKLTEAILKGRVNRTSMGCDVGFSVCSACGNKASSPAEYCEHIPKMKGKILYRHTASGKREGHLIREICHKLSFFENSFLVEDPADPTAVVTGIDDRGLKATAAKAPEDPVFYHGTRYEMSPGDEVVPHPDRGHKRVWMADTPEAAHYWAIHGDPWPEEGSLPHVYEVAPVGAYTKSRRKGDSGEQFYSVPRAHVLREHPLTSFKTASIEKEAAPEGIRFRFTPAGEMSTDHKVEATLPGRSGYHELAGHLSWSNRNGMVSMVSTEHEHKGKGIASALWRRAHEVSSNRGLTPPRHSDIRTPDGIGWADAVDKQSLPNFGGPGQGNLFPVPKEHETQEGLAEPRGGDIKEHLGLDHGYLTSHPRFERMTPEEAEAAHADKHRSVSKYSTLPWPHEHASRKTAKSWMPEQGQNYHGTHCLMCGEDVKYYVKPSQGQHGGMWSHHDSMKRDHLALPADPDKVINGIPAADAARDQAKAEMRKQLGLPSLRDRDMPPDPFTTTSGLRKLSEYWVDCEKPGCGEHWGPNGAAGLLIRHKGEDGQTRHLLQKRAPWVDHGGTWGIPGGALDDGESPHEGAHREAEEEMGDLPHLKHHRTYTDDHGGWAYHTVIMDSPERFEPPGGDDEHAGHGWFTTHEMKNLDLHPGFAQSLRKVTSMRKAASREVLGEYNPLADGDWKMTDSLRAEAAAGPKYPNPADHPFYQQHPSSHENIVKAFHEADEGQRAQGMRWYSDAHHIAKSIGKGDAALGAGVLAAYSPKASWPSNMFNAARSITQGKAVGKGEGDGVMQMHANLAQKMLNGEHYSKVLKSPKISDFAYLIEHGGDGEEGHTRVVVDRHALSVATGHRMSTKDLEDAPLGSRHYYDHVAAHYRAAAGVLSNHFGHPIAPHQVQAVTWLTQQRKNQDADLAQNSGGGKGRVTRDRNSWTRWTEERHHHAPDLDSENLHVRNPHESSLPSVEAYGETKAPADVDTLRTESCPVCGETDSFDGDRCEVCKFIQPPSMFTDPDTGVAKQMDLRQNEFDQGMVGPNGEPIPGVDEQGMAMEEGAPGMPGDSIADLFCPACGFSADTAPPMTNNDPAMSEADAMEDGQQGLLEGDVCPQCGEATMLSPNDVQEMGGEVPQEVADDADADAIPDDQEPDVDGDAVPDDIEDVDGDGAPDDNEVDVDKDGVPDDIEGPQEEPEEEPQEVDQDPNAVEDEEKPPKGRKDNSRRAKLRGHERENMSKQPKTAAAEASITRIAALERTIAVQNEMLNIFGQQMHYLGKLAGVTKEFDALKAQGSKKIADIMNPAQPIPDPPGGAPTETTQQAEAPKTYDDPRNPGLTPGSLDGVPAEATDTPLTPGATLPTSPYTQLVDPTQPVSGTETQIPLDQTKIETDVRVGDPMANAGSPQGTAFPLTGPFAADGAASAGTTTSPGYQQGAGDSGRTMASIRLARLRKSAGLIDVNTDELVAAAEIERTAGLSDEVIAHEIGTLSSLAVQAAKNPARRPQGGPMPKVAHSERRMPSLAAAPEMAMTGAVSDLDDASDLFA